MWGASFTKMVSMTGKSEEYVAKEPGPFLQKASFACFMSLTWKAILG